jgi:hypothetical protein
MKNKIGASGDAPSDYEVMANGAKNLGKLAWWHHGRPCLVAQALMTAAFRLRWQRSGQQRLQLAIGTVAPVLANAGAFLCRLGMVAGSQTKARRTERTTCPLGCDHLDDNECCLFGVAREPLNAGAHLSMWHT